jgi:hypothetical protein
VQHTPILRVNMRGWAPPSKALKKTMAQCAIAQPEWELRGPSSYSLEIARSPDSASTNRPTARKSSGGRCGNVGELVRSRNGQVHIKTQSGDDRRRHASVAPRGLIIRRIRRINFSDSSLASRNCAAPCVALAGNSAYHVSRLFKPESLQRRASARAAHCVQN